MRMGMCVCVLYAMRARAHVYAVHVYIGMGGGGGGVGGSQIRVEEMRYCVRYGVHDPLECLQAGKNPDNFETMHADRYAKTGTKTRAGGQTHEQARIHENPVSGATLLEVPGGKQKGMHAWDA